MRLYLAGPMAGLPEHNFPAFHAEAARLRALGYHVENPAEINADGAPRAVCMRRDLQALMRCEVIALLDGWHTSAGAHCERDAAVQLNITVVMARDLVDQVHCEPARIEEFDPATSVVFDDGFNGRKTVVDLTEAAIRADGVMRENAITAKLVEMGWTPPGKLNAAQTEAYAEGRADQADEHRAAVVARLTDDRIDHIADLTAKAMPNGVLGFMREWGWRQFARNLAEVLATQDEHAVGNLLPAPERDELIRALDRMCTPLDDSRLGGATADADARCMATIRAFVLHALACGVDAPTRAMRDLVTERRRVVEAKGYTAEHDDEHTGGTIALAGVCYALAAVGGESGIYSGYIARMWPWEGRPSGDSRTLLIQAAGLFIAEVERLDRAEARGPWIDAEVHSEVMR